MFALDGLGMLFADYDAVPARQRDTAPFPQDVSAATPPDLPVSGQISFCKLYYPVSLDIS